MTEAEKRVRDAWAKMLETDASAELIDVAMGTKLGRLAVRLQGRVDALEKALVNIRDAWEHAKPNEYSHFCPHCIAVRALEEAQP